MGKNINDFKAGAGRSVLLSICIPTYNMADFLKEALFSISSQLEDIDLATKLEICVNDNGSRDHTDGVINEWIMQKKIRIIYNKNSCNLGFDRNLQQAVSLASGRYCWTLGSDDKIEPGGIRRIISEIERENDIDIFLLNQYAYDFQMRRRLVLRLAKLRPLQRFPRDRVFTDIADILKECVYQFAYLSVLVFRRNLWDIINDDPKVVDYGYIHLYRMLRLVQEGAKVKYIRKESVGWRSNNDIWLTALKTYGRFQYDIVAYDKIASSVFGGHSWQYNTIMGRMMDVYILERVLDLKINGENRETQLRIMKLLFRYFKKYLGFWIEILPLFFVPVSLFRFIKLIYRASLRKLRFRQINIGLIYD